MAAKAMGMRSVTCHLILLTLNDNVILNSPALSTISISHASFHDFISDQILSSKHFLDPGISHKHSALQCLFLMEKEWSEKKRVTWQRGHVEKFLNLSYMLVVAGLFISLMQAITMGWMN